MLYAHALPRSLPPATREEIPIIVANALQFTGSQGPLCDQIPNQNYIDYVRRAVALYLCRDADVAFHTEDAYNEFAADISLAIVEKHLRPQHNLGQSLSGLRTLMVYSLLAGVIGLD